MYRDPVGHRIKTLNNLMKRAMDKEFGHRPDRATLMHTWIIGFLQDREDAKIDTFQKDIEEEFSINRSTTSEIHHRLVDGLTDEEIEFYIQISDKLINNIKNVL